MSTPTTQNIYFFLALDIQEIVLTLDKQEREKQPTKDQTMDKILPLLVAVIIFVMLAALCLFIGINYGLMPTIQNSGVSFGQALCLCVGLLPLGGLRLGGSSNK